MQGLSHALSSAREPCETRPVSETDERFGAELAEPELAEPLEGPAAHSMDTTWFAVDAFGHIGVFLSGESGAVPEDWRESSGRSIVELLLGLGRPDLARFDATRVFEALDELPEWSRGEVMLAPPSEGDERGYYNLLVELTSRQHATPAAIGRALGDMTLERGPLTLASDPPLVLFDSLEAEQLVRLWAAGGVVRALNGYFLPPGRLGLFEYDHDATSFQNTYAAPYTRVDAPRGRPVELARLPTPIRALIGAVRFDKVDFRAAERIQPLEHLACVAWERFWESLDGEMHEREHDEDFDGEYVGDEELESEDDDG